MARRLRRLAEVELLGRRVRVAEDRLSRRLGLAGLRAERAGGGLLIPRCRSVHTFGMRFALDVVFLDAAERIVLVRAAVPPGRVASDLRAAAVLELPSRGESFAARPLVQACSRRDERSRQSSSARTTR